MIFWSDDVVGMKEVDFIRWNVGEREELIAKLFK